MRITVYLTGGIAVYKAVEVVRALEKRNNEVKVVMTHNAEKFVTTTTLAALTKAPVLDDLWQKENADSIPHIKLARWTELAVVVPATANFIAKMANGIADDAASTTILATAAPKMVIPAMNDQMLDNPATQRNINRLEQDGVLVMEPAIGELAEGYVAKGRMPEPSKIVDWILAEQEKTNLLKGKKVVVTAGGTREAIDPVRYIGNRSSGKMGIAIAKAARNAGAEVVLIYGAIDVKLPTGIKTISVESSEEMEKAVSANFKTADWLIMAAAVADWRVEKIPNQKVKKQKNQIDWNLHLVKTPDILKEMCRKKKSNQLVVGFAAETNDLIDNAKKKLIQKGADIIVANNVFADSFGSDENQVFLLTKDGSIEKIARMSKEKVAKRLIDGLVTKL